MRGIGPRAAGELKGPSCPSFPHSSWRSLDTGAWLGRAARFLTAEGTILVIAAFACVGAVLGFIYAGALRELLRRRGLVYGLLLAAVTLQPFLRTAAEDLHRSQRSPEVLLGTIGMSLAMWIPYGVLLEWSIDRMSSALLTRTGLASRRSSPF